MWLNVLDLPPNYIWAVSKVSWKEEVREDPIDFDADFDPKAQYITDYESLFTKKIRWGLHSVRNYLQRTDKY
jgi:hypothetical protein